MVVVMAGGVPRGAVRVQVGPALPHRTHYTRMRGVVKQVVGPKPHNCWRYFFFLSISSAYQLLRFSFGTITSMRYQIPRSMSSWYITICSIAATLLESP